MSDNFALVLGYLFVAGIIVAPLFIIFSHIRRGMQNKEWWRLSRVERSEYGKIAILGLVISGLLRGVWNTGTLSLLLGTIFGWVGLICGVIWIVKTIRHEDSSEKL